MNTNPVPKNLEAHVLRAGERTIGRAKGTPNALTASIKDAIQNAFTELGGTDYLVHVGRTDPRTFCALLSKLLPTKLANADGSLSAANACIAGVKQHWCGDGGQLAGYCAGQGGN